MNLLTNLIKQDTQACAILCIVITLGVAVTSLHITPFPFHWNTFPLFFDVNALDGRL